MRILSHVNAISKHPVSQPSASALQYVRRGAGGAHQHRSWQSRVLRRGTAHRRWDSTGWSESDPRPTSYQCHLPMSNTAREWTKTTTRVEKNKVREIRKRLPITNENTSLFSLQRTQKVSNMWAQFRAHPKAPKQSPCAGPPFRLDSECGLWCMIV